MQSASPVQPKTENKKQGNANGCDKIRRWLKTKRQQYVAGTNEIAVIIQTVHRPERNKAKYRTLWFFGKKGVVKTVLCMRDLLASAPGLRGSVTVYNVMRCVVGGMRAGRPWTGGTGGLVAMSVVVDIYSWMNNLGH
jgi:hypothetical protein